MKNKKLIIGSIVVVGSLLLIRHLYKKNKKTASANSDSQQASEETTSSGGFGGGGGGGFTPVGVGTETTVITTPVVAPQNTTPNTFTPSQGGGFSIGSQIQSPNLNSGSTSSPTGGSIAPNFSTGGVIAKAIKNRNTPVSSSTTASNFNGLADAEMVTNHHLDSMFGFDGLINARLVTRR